MLSRRLVMWLNQVVKFFNKCLNTFTYIQQQPKVIVIIIIHSVGGKKADYWILFLWKLIFSSSSDTWPNTTIIPPETNHEAANEFKVSVSVRPTQKRDLIKFLTFNSTKKKKKDKKTHSIVTTRRGDSFLNRTIFLSLNIEPFKNRVLRWKWN